ncbi:MAG: hypothetical protein ACTS10_21495 [Kiloniellales bacterium]
MGRIQAIGAFFLLLAVIGTSPVVGQQISPSQAVSPPHRAAWVVSPFFPDKWHTATAVAELPGGEGYLVAGQREYNKPGQIAAWAMKLDRQGRTRWWRNFDDAYEVRSFGLAALPDGSAFVAGSAGDSLTARPWIARISPKAWVFWERLLPATTGTWSGIEALTVSRDGTLLVAGTDYASDGTTTTWLLRLSADGEILTRRQLPSATPRGVEHLIELPDGSLALAGPLLAAADTSKVEQQRRDAWIARVSVEGDVIWTQDLSGGPQEEISGLASDGLEGILAAGWQLDDPWHATQAWTRRFAPDGEVIGELTFGGRGLDLLAAVLPGASGGHWLIGTTHPGPDGDGTGPATAWKRSLDADGWLGEAQLLGASARLDLAAAVGTDDGGLLIVGWRSIRAHLPPDIWIARFVLPTG